MDTFYLIDFENVHNEGLEEISSLTKNEHIHIFSTKNALNIRMDFVFSNIDIKGHIVPVRKQSLDMHLVSYLGYLLAIHGKECAYVIVSRDTDYDNIIKFWKEEGYPNISRKQKIPGTPANHKKTVQTDALNGRINVGRTGNFSGSERSKLNVFMQHGLIDRGYPSNAANRICKYVIAHCNDERMLSEIHNDLKNAYDDYLEIYDDVKTILNRFELFREKSVKRELQIRSFFGQHLKKKIYTDNKEEIIHIIVNAKTKQQINNGLLKLYANGSIVKHIFQTIQPLIKELPGR